MYRSQKMMDVRFSAHYEHFIVFDVNPSSMPFIDKRERHHKSSSHLVISNDHLSSIKALQGTFFTKAMSTPNFTSD